MCAPGLADAFAVAWASIRGIGPIHMAVAPTAPRVFVPVSWRSVMAHPTHAAISWALPEHDRASAQRNGETRGDAWTAFPPDPIGQPCERLHGI